MSGFGLFCFDSSAGGPDGKKESSCFAPMMCEDGSSDVADNSKRLKLKHDERTQDKSEQTMFRDDLRERVAVLEQKLEEAYSDKAQTERKLTEVLTKLAEYKVRLEFLEKENDRLKTR